MWLFRKPTIEETKNKAFVYYISTSGRKNLMEKFSKVEGWRIKSWKEEFSLIINEIEKIVEENKKFDYENFIPRISASYPFMNKKSLSKAGWYGAYFAWRQGYSK